MAKAKARKPRRRPSAPRNPYAQHLRRRGKGLERSAKAYKRRPKHRSGESGE